MGLILAKLTSSILRKENRLFKKMREKFIGQTLKLI